MRIECFLQIRVPIHSKARAFRLGKGVKFYSDEITDAMVLFLYEQYKHKQPICCLIGDIGSLLKRKAEIDKKQLGEQTYRQYLESKI